MAEVTKGQFDKLAKVYNEEFPIIKDEMKKISDAMIAMAGCFDSAGGDIAKKLKNEFAPEILDGSQDANKLIPSIQKMIEQGETRFKSVADASQNLLGAKIKNLFKGTTSSSK